MVIKINSSSLQPDKYGNKIVIDRVGVYDDNGKWIKWAKLNESLLNIIIKNEIKYDSDN